MGRHPLPRRLLIVLALCMAAPAQAPATEETGWPVLAVPRRAPCSVEWDDISLPPCDRAAFETRYVRLSEMATIAPACTLRDDAWGRDFLEAVGFLLHRPRPGSADRVPDAAARARIARRLEAARERARAGLARDQRQVCEDLWESTRLAHADALVRTIRAAR